MHGVEFCLAAATPSPAANFGPGCDVSATNEIVVVEKAE
jgi:hypothetical protein